MSTEPSTLALVECAFQQRAEDRRLDRRPIRLCGIDQQIELVCIEWDRLSVFEEAAVEPQDVFAQLGRKAALVHIGP
jgi:hypothetical protein